MTDRVLFLVERSWIYEVGFRAALHTETRPRDLRWFRNIWPSR